MDYLTGYQLQEHLDIGYVVLWCDYPIGEAMSSFIRGVTAGTALAVVC